MPTKKEDLESLDIEYLVGLTTEASELLEQVYKNLNSDFKTCDCCHARRVENHTQYNLANLIFASREKATKFINQITDGETNIKTNMYRRKIMNRE
tara:strand:- start:75 stop:362 length:288 start_codon:yes stop_codon:yes gene_type:complete